MKILLCLFLFFFSVVGQSVCDNLSYGQNRPSTVSLSPISIQAELEALSVTAGDIYDLAKATKWNKIRKKLDELKKSEKTIRVLRNEDNDVLSHRLRKNTDDLEQAILAKNRKETMRSSNAITFIEIAMIGDYKPRVPTNVRLLDYCGRQMELLSEDNDLDKLSNLVVRMHLIWQNLIPQLLNEGDTKEIKHFSEIMKRLDRATTPEEYGPLAKQVLDGVDRIEKLFKKLSSNPRDLPTQRGSSQSHGLH
jgi:hypothetical protein